MDNEVNDKLNDGTLELLCKYKEVLGILGYNEEDLEGYYRQHSLIQANGEYESNIDFYLFENEIVKTVYNRDISTFMIKRYPLCKFAFEIDSIDYAFEARYEYGNLILRPKETYISEDLDDLLVSPKHEEGDYDFYDRYLDFKSKLAKKLLDKALGINQCK